MRDIKEKELVLGNIRILERQLLDCINENDREMFKGFIDKARNRLKNIE